MIEYAIFVFCIIGCGYHAHALGVQEGMSRTIDHFVSTGVIQLDEDE
jgi:hypothetical protein